MTLTRALVAVVLLLALATLWLGAALRPAAAEHPVDQSLGVAVTDYGNDPSVLVDHLTRLQTRWWFDLAWSGAGDPPGFTKVDLLRPCYARDTTLSCTAPGPSVAEVQARVQQRPGRYWMLGNEPNAVDQDNLSPSAYATFLYTYGTAIKQVDPTATIVAPNVLNSTTLCQACAGQGSSLGGAAFTQQMWTAYTQAYSGTAYPTPNALVDVWALHAYQIAWDAAIAPPWTNAAWVQGEIAHYRTTLTNLGVSSSKPLWVTGWGSLLGYPCWESTSQGVRFNCAYDDPAVSQFIQTMVGWLRTTGLMSYHVQRSFLYANFAYPELWQAPGATRAATIRLFESPTLGAPLSPQGQVYANLVGFGQPAHAPAAPPSVAFIPTLVAQGGALTVSGSGFSTGTATATVRLVDSVITTSTAATLGTAALSAGSFGPVSMTVPLTVSVGTYRVQATDGLLTATSAATLTVVTPPAGTLRLTPASVTIAPTGTVAILFDAGSQLVDSAQARVTFDPAALRVVDADGNAANGIQVSPGPDFQDVLANTADNALGRVFFAAGRAISQAPLSGTITLATITFRGAPGLTAAITTTAAFDRDASRAAYEGRALPLAFVDGLVQAMPPPLDFVTQTIRAAHGYPFGVQPAVMVREPTTVTAVGLRILSGTGASGASLTCDQTSGGVTSAVAVAGGVATFSGCQIDRPGAAYVLEATVPGLPAAESAPFNVTLAGDTDGDCRVSILDYSAVVTHFGKTGASADWRDATARPWRADVDGDERVDVVDHSVAVTRFGAQAATCAASSDPSAMP